MDTWTKSEGRMCLLLKPLVVLDGMLNSILLQGLSQAYGQHSLRAILTQGSSLFADPKMVVTQTWLKHISEDTAFDDFGGSKYYQKARTTEVYKSHAE